MIKLKLKLKLILGVSLFVSFSFLCIVCSAQSFDRSLKSLSNQFKSGDYTKVLNRLSALKSSKELEDLYLYLKAESLKNLKCNEEAISIYEELIEKHPQSEITKQCHLPLFLLKLLSANEINVSSLEAMAVKLPSNWQSGNALEKLHNLEFLKSGKKSRFALQALRQYTRGATFYRHSPATHELLKKIWKNADGYEYLELEWHEILKITAAEDMLDEIFNRKTPIPAAVTEKVDSTLLELYKAAWLCKTKRHNEGIKIFTDLINNQAILPEIRASALQQRGDAYHFANLHNEALTDYQKVLKSRHPATDLLAAEYRMMRSLFELNRDSECIATIRSLIKGKRAGSLLPAQIYEMGLKCYDKKDFNRAAKYFMIFSDNYIGHFRADDALGYTALSGKKSEAGKSALKKLKNNYTNSFFLWWNNPSTAKSGIKHTKVKINSLSKDTLKKINRMKKLWGTDFAHFAQAEANILTEKYPRNFGLFKTLIDVANSHDDYQSVCGFGERLARQILETGKSLDQMPLWAWKAMYPLAFEKKVRTSSEKFAIDPYWVLAIMREESHFRVDIKSRSNAISLMQILPSTGKWIAAKLGEKRFKERTLWEPETNIKYGTWYLRYLYDMFNKELILASAAYNGGQGNITRKVEAIYPKLSVLERIDKVPMAETRDYYKKVMGSYYMYKRLYK
ncbi:MAG: lytic transglycosylase domain-containing protein [Candidatus Riflebacteria bacterium]|nr:lytic transglycosylase domain-containing protein [Candidatus Riflebacteria bacterium]